jgi:TIR domain
MTYKHDVFISYRRDQSTWTSWIDKIFKHDLEACLQQDFSDVQVFLDKKIPVGENYVQSLAKTLAASKVMIAILSRAYFQSDWCVHELDLMMVRGGVVFPVIIHDGNFIPDDVTKLQNVDFTIYANPALSGNTPLYAEFWKELKAVAQHIANAIDTAPAFEARWESDFQKRLNEVFTAHTRKRRIPPTKFKLKRDSWQRKPPRLGPGKK